MTCALCGGATSALFDKAGADGRVWHIVRCATCTAWQIQPLPRSAELEEFYQSEYFRKRSDRGYADYTSEKVRRSVISTLEKNLHDLGFFSWEQQLAARQLLEVGCAAGHAVGYFAARGWQALGIDVAREMVEAGRAQGYNLQCADFLTFDFGNARFNLITHWATLEHLPDAKKFLQRMANLLAPGGKIYLSTCNTGYFARRYGSKWRYLNVPEHVFYFNKKSLAHLAAQCGLVITRAFSYGSGFTTRENASWWYRLQKSVADRVARRFLSGDMIVIELTGDATHPP